MRTPTVAWWSSGRTRGVSQEVGSHMDLLPTLAELAGAHLPASLLLDGRSLAEVLLGRPQLGPAQPVYFYRGNILYAVRWEQYKAHFWTWTTPPEELERGIDHCPGARVENVTTTDMRHHGDLSPVMFHLGRDPGERFPLKTQSEEYKAALSNILKVVEGHRARMEPAPAQLEWCDLKVMNWAPPGCQDLGLCQDIPTSTPYLCYWPH